MAFLIPALRRRRAYGLPVAILRVKTELQQSNEQVGGSKRDLLLWSGGCRADDLRSRATFRNSDEVLVWLGSKQA